ncbi:MAG: hypothetical protein DCC67_15550 [Planctomycetota bacterium]|nr:MAG: hypothetical protein DCC67_15550 [Planctomycetota bacterium]
MSAGRTAVGLPAQIYSGSLAELLLVPVHLTAISPLPVRPWSLNRMTSTGSCCVPAASFEARMSAPSLFTMSQNSPGNWSSDTRKVKSVRSLPGSVVTLCVTYPAQPSGDAAKAFCMNPATIAAATKPHRQPFPKAAMTHPPLNESPTAS